MENEVINKTIEIPMNNEGQYSYTQQSSYQKGGVESVNSIVHNQIQQKLNVRKLLSSSNGPHQLFNIADLGCSIGPNTFIAMQNIIDAMELKCKLHGITSEEEAEGKIEFQVFFNDHVTNDFNALFQSLPVERKYYAAGKPGTFHGRLFPKASLHFVHSSYSLHWLSKVPPEVLDPTSPAWNKGKIFYGRKEVEEAYAGQYMKDMDSFLKARSEELVSGGFMAILVPSIPDGVDSSKCAINALFHMIESTLVDMVKMGIVDEAKVDGFNLPGYNTSPEKLKVAIKRNGCFAVEFMEQQVRDMPPATRPRVRQVISGIRAVAEGLLVGNFGSEIMDELFHRYTEKVLESGIFEDDSKYYPFVDLFILVSRL